MMMIVMMMIIVVFKARKLESTTLALVSWDSKEGSLKYALNYWNGWG